MGPHGARFAAASLYTNTSFVAVSCCGDNPLTKIPASSVTAPRPGGGTITVTSACGIDFGVTIAYYNLNPSTNIATLNHSKCYRDYIAMNVSALGSQYFSGGASPFLLFDFVAQTSFSTNTSPSVAAPYYFNFITSAGNRVTSASQPLNSVITCSQLGEFN